MKKIVYILILTFSGLIVSGQNCSIKNDIVKFDTIRKQGYLIIKNDISNSTSDIPYNYVFIPTEKMMDLKNAYDNSINNISKDIFVTAPLIPINGLDSYDLKFILKKFIYPNKTIEIKTESIDEELFFKNASTLFKFKDKNDKTAFKIIFIDGLWLKVPIPKRHIDNFIESNKLKMLDPNIEIHDIYFLVETKFISYDLLINDKSVEIIDK